MALYDKIDMYHSLWPDDFDKGVIREEKKHLVKIFQNNVSVRLLEPSLFTILLQRRHSMESK